MNCLASKGRIACTERSPFAHASLVKQYIVCCELYLLVLFFLLLLWLVSILKDEHGHVKRC